MSLNGTVDHLFGRIRRDLLSLFLFNPGNSFHLLEIVSILRTGRGGVQRELANLVDGALISRRKEGTRVLFQLRPDFAHAEELTALFRSLVDPREMAAEFVRDSCSGAKAAAVIPAAGHRVAAVILGVKRPPEEDIRRLELLSGVLLELHHLSGDSETVLDVPLEAMLCDPECRFITGKIEDLMEFAEKKDDEEKDLFTSAGLDW